MSLKSKYILFTVSILLLTTGIFIYKDSSLHEKEIHESWAKQLSLTADIVRNSFLTLMLANPQWTVQKFVESLSLEQKASIRIINSEGIITGSPFHEQIGTPISSEYITRLNSQNLPDIFFINKKGEEFYSIIVPFNNDNACQRCHGSKKQLLGAITIDMPFTEAIQKINASKTRRLLLTIMFLIAFSTVIGLFTNALISKPISSIVDTMKKAKDGDLTVKFLTNRKDEIGKLASSFNSMLSELDKARQEIEKCHIEEMHSIEKMASLGELASAIAHEIKNPLAGISGAIHVFADDLPPNNPQKEIINEILIEIERLDRAVKDLLIFARPPELHLIKTPLQPIIDRAKRLIEMQSQKQKVSIRNIHKDDIGEITVDPDQIQQVFLNVMINALQSMPDGGTLTISTHLRQNENEVEIAFTDTGHGIGKDIIKNIFKPFFTTRLSGTGLGLAISRNIVEKHNGRITVESQVGIGSTFRIFLKLTDS